MGMPRILFIAPSSYPIFGAESNVNAKVIKLLTDAGCQIDLVCRTLRANIKFYPPSEGDFFFGKLNSVHCINVETKKNIATVVRHILAYIKTGYTYKGADWAYNAIKKCEELIEKNKYDFIYTYDYPSEVVGLYLTKKYGIKWVSTWNDPYIWKRYPKPYGLGPHCNVGILRERLIAAMGKYAYKNIFPSEQLREYMLIYMTHMKRENCVIIPHLLLEELKEKNDKKLSDTLKIIHAGALGRERDPKTFLHGLKIFMEKHPNAKIKVSFLGIFERAKSDYFSELIEEYNVEKQIERIPPVPYIDSLQIIKEYDVCMLLEAACEEGIFLPSKVIDYMQNNKPILAISPASGVMRDMFREETIDYFADVTDAEAIANELEILYYDFEQGKVGLNAKHYEQFGNKEILNLHKNEIFNNL